jgi:hypothetical protein
VNSFPSRMSGIIQESVIFMGGWGFENELKGENIMIYLNYVVGL